MLNSDWKQQASKSEAVTNQQSGIFYPTVNIASLIGCCSTA